MKTCELCGSKIKQYTDSDIMGFDIVEMERCENEECENHKPVVLY